MNRFLWAARGDITRLMQAAVAQFTLSAVPIIYYGTEVGLSQQRDIRQGDLAIMEEARLPMIWDAQSQHRGLFRFYRDLIKLRRESSALRNGVRSAWLVDSIHGRYGFLRRSAQETIMVALNVSDVMLDFDLPAVPWKDAFSGEALNGRQKLPPNGYLVARQG